ncbi:MAG: hypothetical protein H6738_14970 [Alphaproteobacteria bacterium]|nr:hypothetical protein [Alphaproteobacteria bacterium]MCB9698079.1 hypothetical protein [Alphaproteobacteria bacterium]
MPAEGVWALLPFRVPSGWWVRHNGLSARFVDGRMVEVNDSEDLLWLQQPVPPERRGRDGWRELTVDLGWYRDHFRLVLLEPDWDHVVASFDTIDVHEAIAVLEVWLERPPVGNAV